MSDEKNLVTSERYERLLLTLQKVFSSARGQLHTEQILREYYGRDNLDMVGPEALKTVLENLLDSVRDQVLDGMSEYMQQQNMEQTLRQVETVLEYWQNHDAMQQQAQEHDRASAQQALEQASLPKGLTSPEDLLAQVTYDKLMAERNTLLEQIEAIEHETVRIQAEKQALEPQLEKHMQQWQQAAHELEKSADMCSMISS